MYLTNRTITCGIMLLFAVATEHPCQAQPAMDKFAESLHLYVESAYGSDQNLIHGIKYYNLNSRSRGHKFLGEDMFYKGKVSLDGKKYSDILIKYDIYNQHVILEHEDLLGNIHQIVLNTLRVKEFEFNDRIFYRKNFPGHGSMYLHPVVRGDLECYIRYWKELLPAVGGKQSVFQFTGTKRKFFLVRNDDVHVFTNAPSLLRIFPGQRGELRSYLIRNKLIIKWADDEDIMNLIQFCEQVTQDH